MVFIYVTFIVMFFAVLLWAIVCFHYVLQQQRRLNSLWQYINALLVQRNEWMGELQALWGGAPAQEIAVHALQESLAEDTARNWQDVPARAAARKQIEALAFQLLTAARQDAAVAQNPLLGQIEQALRDNAVALEKGGKDYNRAVQIYNSLLQQNPNRFIAGKLGFEAAPYYASATA